MPAQCWRLEHHPRLRCCCVWQSLSPGFPAHLPLPSPVEESSSLSELFCQLRAWPASSGFHSKIPAPCSPPCCRSAEQGPACGPSGTQPCAYSPAVRLCRRQGPEAAGQHSLPLQDNARSLRRSSLSCLVASGFGGSGFFVVVWGFVCFLF